MKISRLHISNFRGIREVLLEELGTMVIIAGQNGSGKSCIFDGIRLLKSVYGGYQRDEWQQWMGEFQISLTNNPRDYDAIFNDRTKNVIIECSFKLDDEERAFISSHAEELLLEHMWRIELPEAYTWGMRRMSTFAPHFRDREPAVREKVAQKLPLLTQELAADVIVGKFQVAPGGLPRITNSDLLGVIFSNYRPSEIGLIDYHGAQRHYGRENVQGINLNLDQTAQQRSQFSLYNTASKYGNVKSEMAAAYIKDILAEKTGEARVASPLSDTLKELFEIFFPKKKFDGPKPTVDGALAFPVTLETGAVHDLDELSAGEKEILYGYLRIRNSAPRYSIIFIDEPELHLNPRLIRGLPRFYAKNLGTELKNQIWLVTHSDALLREVVGKSEYNVFHMSPSSETPPEQPQIRPLRATSDLDIALVDLIGDLAAYRPNGKVVIFEGGGDSDLDKNVTARLFPELQESANLISGSNKARVRSLRTLLEAATESAGLPFTFHCITDMDTDVPIQGASVKQHSWDVYHLENYFLEATFIRKVLESLGSQNLPSTEVIWDELRTCAQETLTQIVRHDLAEFANAHLIAAIDVGTDPKKGDLVGELTGAIERSKSRVEGLLAGISRRIGSRRKKSEFVSGMLTPSRTELGTRYLGVGTS